MAKTAKDMLALLEECDRDDNCSQEALDELGEAYGYAKLVEKTLREQYAEACHGLLIPAPAPGFGDAGDGGENDDDIGAEHVG